MNEKIINTLNNVDWKHVDKCKDQVSEGPVSGSTCIKTSRFMSLTPLLGETLLVHWFPLS